MTGSVFIFLIKVGPTTSINLKSLDLFLGFFLPETNTVNTTTTAQTGTIVALVKCVAQVFLCDIARY